MSIQATLERIASALERIADAVAEDVEDIPVVQPTITAPPLTWFAAIEQNEPDVLAPASALEPGQTTWEWLGITPPATRGRAKMPAVSIATVDGRAEAGRMKRGRPLHCGRCGREGRSRMNHSDRCRECIHEEWWDE